MAEGDAESSVVWTGGVGSPLLRAGPVLLVVAPPWTPHQEVCLETHCSSIISGLVSLAILEMDPLASPTVEITNQAEGKLGR